MVFMINTSQNVYHVNILVLNVKTNWNVLNVLTMVYKIKIISQIALA